MNTRMCLGLVGVALGSVAIGPRAVVADTNRPSATIVKPKRDDTVGATLEVAGRLSVRGKPVVAVRNCEPGSAWRVQEAVEMTGSKTFKGWVRVGEGGEAPGTRFWIVVLTPRSPKEAEPLALGTTLTELPFGVPRSVKLPVQLAVAAQPRNGAAQPADRPEQPIAETGIRPPRDAPSEPVHPLRGTPFRVAKSEILFPKHNSRVSRLEKLIANIERNAGAVVLVRSNERNSPWWIQHADHRVPDGQLEAQVRFGNANTPRGTGFRVVVILPDSPEEVRKYRIGDTIPELPPNVRHTNEVNVTYQ